MFRAAKWARNHIALSLTRRPAIIALAAVMLLFRGTETSDDREFTVYKKERCNPPVRQNRAKHPIIQSITDIMIGRQFTVPALRCPHELLGSCLNSIKGGAFRRLHAE